ncbi:MAG: succinyl-CoA synthetase subunit beta [Marinobacter sp.]|uniref:succinyl-CoA synthetase subunit beta n=1 Tax=Marinobacter sp. TaxID=50741 RepID=UPI0034A04741
MTFRFANNPIVLGLALCVLFPLFFIGGPDWASSPLHRSVWNLGHLIFFGLAVLTWQVVFGVGGWRQWLGLSAAILLTGAVIELVQNGLGRDLDWQDVLRNMIGAWLVMVWRRPTQGRGRWPPTAALWPLRVVVTTLLVFQVVPVAEVGFQRYQMARQLPVVFDINQPQPTHYWSGDVARMPAFGGNSGQSLEVRLGTGKYSGAFLNNMPRDWRGYQQLVFELHNPDTAPIEMTLRVNDTVHDRSDNAFDDRFNIRLLVDPGRNIYRIELSAIESAPADRLMDMANLSRLGLFVSDLPAAQSVFLSELRLEGTSEKKASTE